jgi:hypothetical protein
MVEPIVVPARDRSRSQATTDRSPPMNGRTEAAPGAQLAALVVGFSSLAAGHDDLAAKAREQVSVRVKQEPVRGSVYDRSGAVVLASSVERDRLVAFPASLKGRTEAQTADLRAAVTAKLASILRLDQAGLDELREKFDSLKPYVLIAADLTPAESGAVRSGMADGSLPQVRLEPSYNRVYTTGGALPPAACSSQAPTVRDRRPLATVLPGRRPASARRRGCRLGPERRR